MFFNRGLGNFFLTILFLSCSTIFGQSKNLDIEMSEEIKKLLSLKVLVNKDKYENNYYAIQSNLSFETPNYKVRVGNFKELIEASRKLDFIRKLYPSAFLLKPNNL